MSTYNKADLLLYLSDIIKKSTVPQFHVISYDKWISRSEDFFVGLRSVLLGNHSVILRSSSASEDIDLGSTVGQYNSIVLTREEVNDNLVQKIDSIFEEIIEKEGVNDKHKIIVQKYVGNTVYHGVALNYKPTSVSPYYLLNINSTNGTTDTITQGVDIPRKIFIQKNIKQEILEKNAAYLVQLIKALNEIESLFEKKCIDIEFGIDESNAVHLFQVRFMSPSVATIQTAVSEKEIFKEIKHLSNGHFKDPHLLALSNMTDWNPAEMIGFNPHALSYSLYEYLITNKIWRAARVKMGYNKEVGPDLMLKICNHPYIDVCKSIRSLLPEKLSSEFKNDIVERSTALLNSNKTLHDKMEFEIAISSFSFLMEKKLAKIGLTNKEAGEQLEGPLRDILLNGLNPKSDSSLEFIVKETLKLESFSKSEKYRSLKNDPSLDALFEILNVARTGTYYFAILARYAFIAESILRDLIELNLFSKTDVERFKLSLDTVEKEMLFDMDNFRKGIISLEEFKGKYGHLRPGTYDLTQDRLDSLQMESFLINNSYISNVQLNTKFKITSEQQKKLAALLNLYSLDTTPKALFSFFEKAIINRERGKFIFSIFLSDSLEKIKMWGKQHKIPVDKLLDVDIPSLRSFNEKKITMSQLKKKIEENTVEHMIGQCIPLPSYISSMEDIYYAEEYTPKPNFITTRIVKGEVVLMDKIDADVDFTNKIVLIERADPGYDFIFSSDILGIVTKYGGSNSHLALRCTELGIPAAIGCDNLFDDLVDKSYIILNCKDQKIEYVYWNNGKS
ncbi:PEP-utilising enzyme, mobile domain [Chitinophaga sp. CF118]|uniref:PEP-utilizing enzyme n=1 Tax=Chitinophaga sp. CF118 TaxID=1884367 RepID=UPI0008E9B75D|nr:PEP-utilizing enzyme [Chitinophaga sp. CF118]SFD01199.1 PEP-utilising enzyme, mobile domain [Chitinophaga sp. CF118]